MQHCHDYRQWTTRITFLRFEQLDHTGTDKDGAVYALRTKFKEFQNRLSVKHTQILLYQKKREDETWDSFMPKLKVEAEHCDFLEWHGTSVNYDRQAEHELDVDGCPMELAATLLRRGSLEIKFVRLCSTLASRRLTDTEKRQSQIDLGALAGDFTCSHVTDHKPALESVFRKLTCMQRPSECRGS